MENYYTEHLDELTANVLMGSDYDPNCSYYMTTERFGDVVITAKNNNTGEETEIVLEDDKLDADVSEPENIFLHEETPKGYKIFFYLGLTFCIGAILAAIVFALYFPL